VYDYRGEGDLAESSEIIGVTLWREDRVAYAKRNR